MPGGRSGGRYLAPISTGAGTQFRFLFQKHRRQSNVVLRDASIAWASCSRPINQPSWTKPVMILTRNTTYGVMTIDKPKVLFFKKPCGADKTVAVLKLPAPKTNTSSTKSARPKVQAQ